eukprot:g3385.t1
MVSMVAIVMLLIVARAPQMGDAEGFPAASGKTDEGEWKRLKEREDILERKVEVLERQVGALKDEVVRVKRSPSPAPAIPPPPVRSSSASSSPGSAVQIGKEKSTTTGQDGRSVESLLQRGLPKIAVLVICYNRPEYLSRTLSSLLANVPKGKGEMTRLPIFVSQDGSDMKVAEVVKKYRSEAIARGLSFEHLKHRQTSERGDTGYHKLARHFKWAFATLFDNHPDLSGAIVLEDDMEVAVDFFDMFFGLMPVLESDPTIFTISAWSDNGKPEFVSDPRKIYRSDFFPGLGWLMTRKLWNELGPKWPAAYWDDWLREPAQRKGRACLRPEIARTHNFGAMGVSAGQYYAANIAPVKLNEIKIDFRSVGGIGAELAKAPYDAALRRQIEAARQVVVSELRLSSSLRVDDDDIYVVYTSVSGREKTSFKNIAKALGIMSDEKAGVPRTAYNGVVSVRRKGGDRWLFIVPKEGFRPYNY